MCYLKSQDYHGERNHECWLKIGTNRQIIYYFQRKRYPEYTILKFKSLGTCNFV